MPQLHVQGHSLCFPNLCALLQNQHLPQLLLPLGSFQQPIATASAGQPMPLSAAPVHLVLANDRIKGPHHTACLSVQVPAGNLPRPVGSMPLQHLSTPTLLTTLSCIVYRQADSSFLHCSTDHCSLFSSVWDGAAGQGAAGHRAPRNSGRKARHNIARHHRA